MIIGSFINVQGEVYEYYSLDTTSRELTKQIMNSVTGELEVIPYEFVCSIDEETFLSGWDKTTEIDDFEIGDLVYIMYDGYVVEIYPCGIDKVYSVTLLDNGNESIRKRIENDDIINIDIIDENTFDLKTSNTTDTYTPLTDMKIVCEEYYSSDSSDNLTIENVDESP